MWLFIFHSCPKYTLNLNLAGAEDGSDFWVPPLPGKLSN